MEYLRALIGTMMNLDTSLMAFTSEHGTWTYLLLFGIVFAETGLVVMPFLPGDSLLFAAGAVAGNPRSGLNILLVMITFIAAAFIGDNVNYWVGRLFGERLFRNPDSRVFKRKHLEKTHAFFERHGGKTIIMARFVPIVRTFTPFVAGMGSMTYPRFLLYSVCATLLWVLVCTSAGFYFGRIPVVKNNFEMIVIAIVLISVLPMVVEVIRHRRATAAAKA